MTRSLARRILGYATFPIAAMVAFSTAGAQKPSDAEVKITEEKPGLFRRASVTGDSARKVALARVAGGRVTKGELEEEDGRLIYSFDIKINGKRGIEEVHVDAKTGAIVKTEHESDDPAPASAKAGAAKPAATKP